MGDRRGRWRGLAQGAKRRNFVGGAAFLAWNRGLGCNALRGRTAA